MTRWQASFRYRAMIAQIIARYHRKVAATWIKFDRPIVSADCQAELNECWAVFSRECRRAGDWLDQYPPGLNQPDEALRWLDSQAKLPAN